jgi:hypothetical protein
MPRLAASRALTVLFLPFLPVTLRALLGQSILSDRGKKKEVKKVKYPER